MPEFQMTAPGLVQIYQCFCDETRLRILNLLTRGPLCVCHLQALLGEPQVKISKHLGYLRSKEVVEVTRHQNWMIYSLPAEASPELEANLKCLQDCVQSHRTFKDDLRRLARLRPKVTGLVEASEPSRRSRRRCAAPCASC